MRAVLFVVFVFFAHAAMAQWVIKKDLNESWLTSDSAAYKPFQDNSDASSVYISISVRTFKTDYLIVKSANPLAMLLNGVVVLDGAMATELEARGCNLADSLWSAKVLVDNPELIREVHLDYFRAGAKHMVD